MRQVNRDSLRHYVERLRVVWLNTPVRRCIESDIKPLRKPVVAVFYFLNQTIVQFRIVILRCRN